MADLLTLPEYRALFGIDPTNTRDDAQISALLPAASDAIRSYTDRKFETSGGVATQRSFLYDGSGFLDIDDCTAITTVTYTYPNATPIALDPGQWIAMPDAAPINYYLILGGLGGYDFSPAMGFERNLDQYQATFVKPPTIAVTATWGWTTIPSEVKLAAALTIQGFVESRGAAEGLSAEAIEGWSRSYGGRTGITPALSIPNRARDLLTPYVRVL